MVSSRTRQGVRDVAKVADDGTLPSRRVPKYDLNGDLAWWVYKIDDVREVGSSDDIVSVEFKISCGPERYRIWDNPPLEGNYSWEDVSVLNSSQAREQIVDYYTKNLTAAGKQAVLDSWELRVDNEMHYSKYKKPEENLEKLIQKVR